MKKDYYQKLFYLLLLTLIQVLMMRSFAQSNSYFPLEIGLTWEYNTQCTHQRESIIANDTVNGKVYFIYDTFRLGADYKFRAENDSVYLLAGLNEYLFYDFTADSGDTWNAPEGPWALSFGSEFTVLGKNEFVSTPSGTFHNCILLHHFIGADAEFYEWFAQGVGIVERDVITIAGLTRWQLKDHITTVIQDGDNSLPREFILHQNYPNPFNPTTKIKFVISTNNSPLLGGVGGGLTTLKVYDILGREVATLLNKPLPAGTHEVEFDAAGLPSGVYFYKLTAGKFTETKKMILLR